MFDVNSCIEFIEQTLKIDPKLFFGVVSVLIIFLGIFLKGRKGKKKDKLASEHAKEICYELSITPSEYLKKMVNSAESGTVPFELADDFLYKLGIKSNDIHEKKYQEIFYSWLNSTMGLLNRYQLSDTEDIGYTISTMIATDQENMNVLKKIFYKTQIDNLSDEKSFIEINNWRMVFCNYNNPKNDCDHMANDFLRYIHVRFMRFIKSGMTECPEEMVNISSVLEGDKSLIEDIDIILRPRLESDESKPDFTLSFSHIDNEDELPEEPEPFFEPTEDYYKFRPEDYPEDNFFELTDDDPMAVYPEHTDEPSVTQSMDELGSEGSETIVPEVGRVLPTPDTFSLTVEPDLISAPFNKGGKMLRRVKVPNKNGEDKLKDSFIVDDSQVEDSGEDFFLVTLPVEGERNLYKQRIVAVTGNTPIYETVKETVPNIDIKNRFNEYYVSQLSVS